MVNAQAVPWRRAVAIVAVTAAALTAVVAVVRSDGLPAIDASATRATRWFVHRATGRVVLADGYGGRALARLDAAADGSPLAIAEGAGGAYLLDGSSAEARLIDSAALRLGPGVAVAPLAEPDAVAGVGRDGLVVVAPATSEAALLALSGETIPFEVDASAQVIVAPDGAVWSIDARRLVRTTSTDVDDFAIGTGEPLLTLVGSAAFVLDRTGARARFHDGDWVALPADVQTSELVVQVQGPAADCAWLGADDDLWCIGRDGIDEHVTIDGLDIDGADHLAIAGDAGELIRQGPPAIVRIDWREQRIYDDVVATVSAGSALSVAASVDMIWVDDSEGDFVWSINPWGLNAISKNDTSTPLLGEFGEVIEDGSSSGGSALGPAEPGDDTGTIERRPDDNGIDDPPVAIDDPVTSRAGKAVPVVVTANDYDPDGEAIAVVEVGDPSHGTVDVASASTVVYQPEPGYVGLDRFDYTIVDGNGTEASASVILELLPADAPNRAPVARNDVAETGPDVGVVIDVLLNDVDPERDALRVASFTPPDIGGVVTETIGPSGLPALHYQPPFGVSGRATFTYRPSDTFEGTGEPATVRVEIAQPNDENRPPIVQPDAVRLRRNTPTAVPVLANDRDPDGDPLQLSVAQPLPPGLEAVVDGDQLRVTARAGAAELVPFTYLVDDLNGNVVTGTVLVVTISEAEPNRPPLVTADTATAVVGTTQVIDVLSNDSDPDGDPLVVIAVSQPDDGSGQASIQGDNVQFAAAANVDDDESRIVRFTYTVSDANGHEVAGEIGVRVLSEPLAAPPYARDDTVTTQVDVAVTLDVLGNDGDPSGERPGLVGAPSCPSGGRATVTSDQRVTFTPPDGASGVFRCTYEVTNQRNLRATASIIVSVVEPTLQNLPPVVIDERETVDVLGSITVDVLANDSDPDGVQAGLTVLSSTTPGLGTADRQGGVITFTAGSVLGPTVITYQVGDPDGGVSTGRLVIQILEPIRLPPIAVDDFVPIIGPGVATRIDVLANDSDPDTPNSALTVVSVTRTSGNGTVALGQGTVTLTPAADFVGNLVATYQISDDDGLRASASVTLQVLEPLNRAPIARDDTAQLVGGDVVDISVLFNDDEPDGDPLELAIIAAPDPALGSAQVRPGGIIRFSSQPGAVGTATVGYQVDDGELTANAVLRVSILPCGQAPPAAPNVFLQTAYMQPIAVDLATYARNGEIVDVGPPLSAASGVISPASGESGNIVFDYSVVNICRQRDTGTVTIDVNQDPVAQPYQTSMGRTEQRSIPVSDLATDAEPLTVGGLGSQPSWVTVAADGIALAVDPAGAAAGVYDFTATVRDPGGLSVVVSVRVELMNRPPVANDDSVNASAGPITFRPVDNDTDPDGDPLQLQSVPQTITFSNGNQGTITLIGTDQLLVDPGSGGGIATFTYTVVDTGGLVSAPATVTVRVNRPPTADPVQATIDPDVATDVPLVAGDPDGDPVTVTLAGVPDDVVVTIAGLVLTITAPASYAGSQITFDYTVTDPSNLTATALVTIDVTGTAPTTTTTTPTTTTPTTTTPTTTLPA